MLGARLVVAMKVGTADSQRTTADERI